VATADVTSLSAFGFPPEIIQAWAGNEPQHWSAQLRRQGVSATVLAHLRRNVSEQGDDTARAKKAAACLYYVSGMPMGDIERAMGQFDGAFDGSSRQIRSTAARACDVLPAIARAADLLHPDHDAVRRVGLLIVRLDLG
jgi:helicase